MPFHELIIDSSNPATYAGYGSSDFLKTGSKRTYAESKNDEYVRKMLLQKATKMSVTKFNDINTHNSNKSVSQSTPKEPTKTAKRDEISGTAVKDSSKSLALVGKGLTLTPNKGSGQSPVKKSSPYLNEYLKSLQKDRARNAKVRGKSHLEAMKNNFAKARKDSSGPVRCPQKQKFEAQKYIEGRSRTLPERKKSLPSRLEAGDIYYVDYVPYLDVETDSSLSNYEDEMSSDESLASEDFDESAEA